MSAHTETCRFCDSPETTLTPSGPVCQSPDCREFSKTVCSLTLPCGHQCGGVKDEKECLPCLHGCDQAPSLRQDSDDMCMVCFTDTISAAPAIMVGVYAFMYASGVFFSWAVATCSTSTAVNKCWKSDGLALESHSVSRSVPFAKYASVFPTVVQFQLLLSS